MTTPSDKHASFIVRGVRFDLRSDGAVLVVGGELLSPGEARALRDWLDAVIGLREDVAGGLSPRAFDSAARLPSTEDD